MLDLIDRYKQFIKFFHVLLFEQEGEGFRFKAQVIFTDSSKLFIKEYLFENRERKYSYHWSDSSGDLICRWDNANHWVDIATHPHHKHIGNDVFESIETSIEDVLPIICDKLHK